MRCPRISALGLASVAIVLGGCASAPAKERSRAERVVCINRAEINIIRALDDEHVFVKLSAGSFYLFTVEKRCDGLRLARTIAIDTSRSRVCGDGDSLLSFEYPAVGSMRCRIQTIDSVADMAAALELIESRAEAK